MDRTTSARKKCLRYNIDIATKVPGTENSDFVVKGELFQPHSRKYGHEPKPFIIHLVTIGGENFLDRWLAKTLCKRGIASLTILNDFTGLDGNKLPPVTDHDDAFRRVVASAKAGIAFARDSEEIDSNKVGLYGASLGGILGAFTIGVVDDISAATLLVAGSDVPKILAHSDQKKVKGLKKKRKKAEGIATDNDYEAYLRNHLYLDPFDVARRVPSRNGL